MVLEVLLVLDFLFHPSRQVHHWVLLVLMVLKVLLVP